VTATAAKAAHAAGARTAVLHSTPMAVGLSRSMGFRHVADFALVS
jgi:hypothetical protein